MLVYVCFVLAPIVISFGYSFTNYNPFNPPTRFVGLRNYRLLFTDTEFLTSLKVTTILTLIVVIVPNVAGLAVAVLLDRRGWLYNALRSVFFVPMVLSSVVVSIIWTRMLDDDGLVNQALRGLGVAHPPGWLSDPSYALYSLGGILSWQMLGFCVVVWLAGLQGVPTELAEAAAIDGAGPIRRFRSVTWPLVAPALTINGEPVNEARAPWIRPLVAIAVSAVFVVPLYVVCVNVIKQGSRISREPAALPIPPTLENIRAVLTRPDHLFWASLTNSVVVTVLSILVLTVLSAMLGHYLARRRSRWTRALMLLLLCGLMIPPQVILMPVTQVLRMAHLISTVQGLVLFNVGYYIPFGVFVFSGFMRSIAVELEEAASIDGASRGQVFWRIVFPLLRPATASVLIFLGVWIWNDFLDPLIILGPSQGTTITTGIYRAIGQYQADFGTVFALMFLATLPVLIFYLALQKQFVKGLTGGATKG